MQQQLFLSVLYAIIVLVSNPENFLSASLLLFFLWRTVTIYVLLRTLNQKYEGEWRPSVHKRLLEVSDMTASSNMASHRIHNSCPKVSWISGNRNLTQAWLEV